MVQREESSCNRQLSGIRWNEQKRAWAWVERGVACVGPKTNAGCVRCSRRIGLRSGYVGAAGQAWERRKIVMIFFLCCPRLERSDEATGLGPSTLQPAPLARRPDLPFSRWRVLWPFNATLHTDWSDCRLATSNAIANYPSARQGHCQCLLPNAR